MILSVYANERLITDLPLSKNKDKPYSLKNHNVPYQKLTLLVGKDNNPLSLGDLIYYLRIQRNWTQEYVAQKAGLSCRAIGLIERDKHKPYKKTLIKISRVFKTDLLGLLNYGFNDTTSP